MYQAGLINILIEMKVLVFPHIVHHSPNVMSVTIGGVGGRGGWLWWLPCLTFSCCHYHYGVVSNATQ